MLIDWVCEPKKDKGDVIMPIENLHKNFFFTVVLSERELLPPRFVSDLVFNIKEKGALMIHHNNHMITEDTMLTNQMEFLDSEPLPKKHCVIVQNRRAAKCTRKMFTTF